MAIYHLSVKAISRSAGRSATAAAAYRAGCEIADERTGEIHDYTRKGGVESADIVLPNDAPDWANDRAKLWNAAERSEKRKDACVAREFEVALPAELSSEERRKLALDFAKDMANREGCAVDVAIHAPGKEGDNRNYHAHILRTTRKVQANGLGEKLDTEKAGRKRSDDLEAVRVRWADMTNAALERANIAERIDHRTLNAQGIDRKPTKHLGVEATGYERRTGEKSEKRARQERAEKAALVLAEHSEKTDKYIAELSNQIQREQLAQDWQNLKREAFLQKHPNCEAYYATRDALGATFENDKVTLNKVLTAYDEQVTKAIQQGAKPPEAPVIIKHDKVKQQQEQLAQAFLKAKTGDDYVVLKQQHPQLVPAIDRLQSVMEKEKADFAKVKTLEARDKAYAAIATEKKDLIEKIRNGEPLPKPIEKKKTSLKM